MNINLNIDSNNFIITDLEQKTKNQDFSLYIEKKLTEEFILQIPLVSIECKTYLDKTMLEGCINTAKRIKNGNPKSNFYIVAETLDISDDETITADEINEIYIIRKCKRREKENISFEVINNLYERIKTYLFNLKSNIKPSDQIRKTGTIKK